MTPFVLAAWSTGKVGPDIHVKVGPALYSVPWRLLLLVSGFDGGGVGVGDDAGFSVGS